MQISKKVKQSEEVFHYCFYHIYTLKHTNYHHVIMKYDPDDKEIAEVIKSLDAEQYQYKLISAQPIFLDEEKQAELIIRGLIMDGESLLKRLKAQVKIHSTSIQ